MEDANKRFFGLRAAIQDSEIEMHFRVFFIPKFGEHYSYKIDIIPKMEYNVLESEVYSLCI